MGQQQSNSHHASANHSYIKPPPVNPDDPIPQYASAVSARPQLPPQIKRAFANFTPQQLKQKLYQNSLPIYHIRQFNAYYQGQWREGLPHGLGNLYFEHGGYYYAGEMRQGHADTTQGVVIYPNGSIYEGSISRSSFKDGQKSTLNGYGKLYTLQNQFVYTGNFKDGIPSGEGEEAYSDGTYYKGTFLNGEKNGRGVYIFNQGDMKYQGQFKSGLMTGKGRLICKSKGEEYEGQFLKGQKHGQGKLQNKFGIFSGYFKNDKLNGQGTFTWKDKKIYSGEFKDTIMHGKGKIIYPNKQVVEGIWQNGHNVLLNAAHNNEVQQASRMLQ